MIKLRGINKYFLKGKTNEVHALRNVELELPETGMIAIFGKSGCGKTTLLNVIGGLEKADSGTVTIDGEELTPNSDRLRNEGVGYIFQNYNLNKNESCFENVADALRLLGMRDGEELERRVLCALSAVGMEKYVNRLPDTLSGGQQQRVAIARAIVKRPRIILADEPTGNLDEANTVMIMELLRKIAKEQPVLLVTHEAHLVDHYCNEVIELKDGSVVNHRICDTGAGVSLGDRNTAYLSDMEHTSIAQGGVSLDYYGENLPSDMKLRLINHEGKLYLEVRGASVKLVDSTSELRVDEGSRMQASSLEKDLEKLDLSPLTPVEAKHHGRLFGFIDAVKSGHRANFGKLKKGKKTLIACLTLFAVAVVYVAAIFGTSIGGLITADKSYSHNTYYIKMDDPEVGEKLLSAVGKDNTGVDYTRLLPVTYQCEDVNLRFYSGFFESFTADYSIYEGFEASGVMLPRALADGMELVAGEALGGDSSVLISTAYADKLLETSVFEHVSEYSDLIGLICRNMGYNNLSLRIGGVVRQDNESAVYVDEMVFAEEYGDADGYYRGSKYMVDVGKGEAVIAIMHSSDDQEQPSIGDSFTIHGSEYKVSRILMRAHNYQQFLEMSGVVKLDPYEFFKERVLLENPDLDDNNSEDMQRINELTVGYMESPEYKSFFEYYFDLREEYLLGRMLFTPDDFHTWLALEKGCIAASCSSGDHYFDYYYGMVFESSHGYFPGVDELYVAKDDMKSIELALEEEMARYVDDFYENNVYHGFASTQGVFISDEDFISAARGYGITDRLDGDPRPADDIHLMLVHSSDPKKTEQWLAENPDIGQVSESLPQPIIRPGDVYDNLVMDELSGLISGVVTLCVVLAFMSVSMYFIMRSALMGRIKEIGIYRAIGVSRKNILFRFAVETGVLVLRTVMIGYILATVLIIAAGGISPLISNMLYYPWWYALLMLALLIGVSMIMGLVPVLALLRRSPSEILAKYDI